jgi:hypothetical protein
MWSGDLMRDQKHNEFRPALASHRPSQKVRNGLSETKKPPEGGFS